MESELTRRGTFKVWFEPVSVDLLASAGLYKVDEGVVECFHCHKRLHKWKAGDIPWFEHQKISPLCAFVNGLPCGNIDRYATWVTEYKRRVALEEDQFSS